MKSLTYRLDAADVHDLDDIRGFLENAVMRLCGDEEIAGDLVLAVNEAVTNVMLHGYLGEPGEVSVAVEADENDLLVRLTDNAPLFDPTTVPPPDITLPLEERPLGGLGVHMMRQLADELLYRVTPEGCNELIFLKRGVVTERP